MKDWGSISLVTGIALWAIFWIVIFCRKKRTKSVTKPTSDFSIEFYPLTKRYYPKYKKRYLKTERGTGITRSIDFFDVADYGLNVDEANTIITMFKEQQLKQNVKTIQSK